MNIRKYSHWLCSILLVVLVANASAQTTEHHTATRLGNPPTSFAPTIYSVAQMRARFASPALVPDFIDILQQWGWTGDPADMFAAAATNDVVEWNIAVGDTMPFMSSREQGRPLCLRNVTWAGLDPIHAYAFTFHSKGRIWRCVVPKPCSNFFVEDLGAEPRMGIALDCDVPEKVILGREAKVCLTFHNTGEAATPAGTVTLPMPDTTTFIEATAGGTVMGNAIVWRVPSLATNDSQQLCARLKTSVITNLAFNSVAAAGNLPFATSSCATAVIGVPAILLEKADDPDPVSVGESTTYTVKVTNQGTTGDSNVQVVVIIAPELEPVSSSSGGKIDGQVVTFPEIPDLSPKDAVTYTIVAKGVKTGDGHTKFTLSSDILSSPISAEESTTVY